MSLITFDHVVLHRELPRGIDRSFFGHEIAYVTVRRKYLEIITEVFFDGLGFRRRFDDDEILGHVFRELF